MRIFHLSDWHCLGIHFKDILDQEIRSQGLEEPDGIFLTGDMIRNFRPRQHDFAEYEENRQYQEWQQMIDVLEATWPGVDIFAVRGNHDWCNYSTYGVKAFDNQMGNTYEWRGLKIHGFRGVPRHMGFWKDECSELMLEVFCDQVPLDTDILVTHAPPDSILDDANDAACRVCGGPYPCHHILGESNDGKPYVIVPRHIGSTAIRALVDKRKLKAHLFGHVHEQGGQVQVRGNTIFSNAACHLNQIVL